MNFNARGFLVDRWGDPDKLLAFLHAYGYNDVRRPTVNQWFRRGRIPSDWQATLFGLVKMETGASPDIDKYLS